MQKSRYTEEKIIKILREVATAVPSEPFADPNGPYVGEVGTPITFDGTGSSDPDGSPLTYDWTFGDGSTGTGEAPTHTYAAVGQFTVSLEVTNASGIVDTGFTTATIQEMAIEPGDLGSHECRQVQLEAQAAVLAGKPYDNHGGMVSTAAKVVSGYAFRLVDGIACECASCIVHQFAHRTPIAEQEPCGIDSPDPECEPATCDTFVPCDNPGGCSDPICISTAEGLGVCVEGGTFCDDLLPCTVTADCPAENYCAVETCCITPVCVPESLRCGGTAPTTATAVQSAGCGGAGPTLSSP